MVRYFISTCLALVLLIGTSVSKAADEIVIGLTMVKTGFLKTPG